MLKTLSMLSLLIAGVIAGLVLSGRALDRPEIIARTPDAPVAAERATEPQAVAPAPAPSGGPDFTRVAAQTVRAVTNISSVQVCLLYTSPSPRDS